MINTIALVVSCYCLFQLIFVRIAKSSWKTVQARYLAVYLGYALVHYGVIFFALERGVSFYAVILGLTQVLWLWNTHEDWKEGIPDHMRTGHGSLGPAEIESRP